MASFRKLVFFLLQPLKYVIFYVCWRGEMWLLRHNMLIHDDTVLREAEFKHLTSCFVRKMLD